uniref:Uncharacterized protein n=1 Tax=Pectinophora gossypiella TaxID=13191 RepID=A0A1E1WMD0_PECGO
MDRERVETERRTFFERVSVLLAEVKQLGDEKNSLIKEILQNLETQIKNSCWEIRALRDLELSSAAAPDVYDLIRTAPFELRTTRDSADQATTHKPEENTAQPAAQVAAKRSAQSSSQQSEPKRFKQEPKNNRKEPEDVSLQDEEVNLTASSLNNASVKIKLEVDSDEEPSTSYASQIIEEPSTSYAAQIKEEPSTTYVSPIKEEPSTSYASKINEAPSTSYASQINEAPSTSYASQIKEEPSTSYASQIKSISNESECSPRAHIASRLIFESDDDYDSPPVSTSGIKFEGDDIDADAPPNHNFDTKMKTIVAAWQAKLDNFEAVFARKTELDSDDDTDEASTSASQVTDPFDESD